MFTDKKEILDEALAFKAAAIADGWTCAPTYKLESMERAASLEKEGFKLSIITRDNAQPSRLANRYYVSVSAWGPDGLVIKLPRAYDFDTIRAALRTCNYCNAANVDTFRVYFAGRCCAECLPEQRKRLEKPGWTA